METIERRSQTEVRVDDKLYAFDSGEQADRFEQCAREGRASECVANYPPRTTAPVSAPAALHRSGAGITIGPPPGAVDEEP
ncbi:hypothetical protein [Paraburkholderia lycopersici]|uniref:Uncharacterized protein n=1 Tax=Paraburkholderia lycopersici TaxID=416944 RepID=A0A1G6SK74_9BURK|nr:hypothetical protein [Paraburkholderia lycopersici]SDD17238.1 hypothetical protein SAMN05421548_115105 [Paraburkholderia lycopersici]